MAKRKKHQLPSNTNTSSQNPMHQLLQQYEKDVALPKVGTIIEGTVLSAANNEVNIDINGICTGVVRGPELFDESGMFTNLKPDDKVFATVLDIENERGEVELSFREAGHAKAWEELNKFRSAQKIVEATIVDANRGGLIVRVGHVSGFLPVSQLSIEHYPRVEGGNKHKILERLKTYMGENFQCRVIDVDETEGKLILSEKAAKEEEQSAALANYKIGEVVEGRVTGVVDFGAFVEFADGLEGLVHISELAWQRIDNPKDIINVGDQVKAVIISLDRGRISLSMRRLQEDPWQTIAKKYVAGEVVEGTVLKINLFGAFVELDRDIHGLAHISELSWEKIKSPEDVLKIGERRKFKIVSIEPHHHRLGLSVKQLSKPPAHLEKAQKAEQEITAPEKEVEKAAVPAVEAAKEAKDASEPAEETTKQPTPETNPEATPEAQNTEPQNT